MSSVELIAVVMVLVGAALIYVSRRRRFQRINAYGVEQFPSYGRKLTGKFGDAVLLALGVMLACIGVTALAQENLQSWGWIVLAPVGWLLVVGYIPGGKR